VLVALYTWLYKFNTYYLTLIINHTLRQIHCHFCRQYFV
jgi:hypothetical protein